ncbi:protein prune homolog 2 [Culicoides brevitarsis]|uniref:protein prune homolog 2 n=1 Tax=Culicoides brevitarsis TaxID=469753 RepID=UPI00307C889B
MNYSSDTENYDGRNGARQFSSLSVQSHDIDNRSLDNLNNAKGLTPVNSHPLMMQLSPTGSNSSSEIEYCPPSTTSTKKNSQKSSNFQTYPDLVPETDKNSRLLSNGTTNANHQHFKHHKNCTTLSTLDVVNNSEAAVTSTKLHGVRKKIAVLEEPSNVSSGSEPDLSQYQAAVAPTYESVTLISKSAKNKKKPSTLGIRETQRKITLEPNLFNDDLSSPDTISGQSFDERGRRMSLESPTNSIFDDPFQAGGGVEEENPGRDRSNWVKVILPDGKTREIDMKVIEPYKRILSHGGYLNNKKNAIIIFSSCFLPDRSRSDYHYVMANLFLYVIKTLQQLITDDYVLIYFHGGSNKNNVPPFRWLKKCYQLIDRRLRKSLKNMYLVHPSFWLKSMVWMLRPFVSAKFWRKLVYVNSLEELYTYVTVEKAAVPDKVKNHDAKHS